jgi:hypothetical protein
MRVTVSISSPFHPGLLLLEELKLDPVFIQRAEAVPKEGKHFVAFQIISSMKLNPVHTFYSRSSTHPSLSNLVTSD